MQVFPVPAKNLLNIIIQSNKVADGNIILTDMYGRAIKRMKVNIQNGANNFSLNTGDIADGYYILKVDGLPNLNNQKIVIIH